MSKNMKNFGKIKNAYNTILIESIATKKNENKVLFKNYLKKIKEYEILKEEFLIYNNIENKIETDRFKATEYVKESIALLTKYPKQSIIESNAILVGSQAIELGVDVDIDYDNKELHEAITTLIFTDKKANTLDIILEATDKVVDYIMNNQPREIFENLDIPNSMLLSLSVDTFNNEYKDLNESEKTLISILIESTLEERSVFFKDTNHECLTLINNKLTESDINSKEKLLSVKERLLNQTYNDESFSTDIIKLIDLKETLKN